MKVLIVEDEKNLNKIIAKRLKIEGYSTDSAFDGLEALECLSITEYDAILLDIMLPKLDGFALLQRLRASGNKTPVLFLTAKDTIADKVAGLDSGADDYLVKPFDFRELLARVRTLVRRSSDQQRPILKCGGLVLDPVARECRVDNVAVPLRRREFDILELLMRYENQVFSRERIITHVWQKEYDGTSNVVDVHVKYLRDKLRKVGYDALIVTVRGVGYKVNCPAYN